MLLHVGPSSSVVVGRPRPLALAAAETKKKASGKKPSRSPAPALSSRNDATRAKFARLAPASAGEMYRREDGGERASEREGGREGERILHSFRTTGVTRGNFDAPASSIEDNKKRLSPDTHHVHAPVLVDDGSVRVVNPAAIGRSQVERGPLGASRRLLPPLRLRRRKHFDADAADDSPLLQLLLLLLRSSPSLRPGSLRDHEELATASATLRGKAAVACGGARRAQHRGAAAPLGGGGGGARGGRQAVRSVWQRNRRFGRAPARLFAVRLVVDLTLASSACPARNINHASQLQLTSWAGLHILPGETQILTCTRRASPL